MKVWRYIRGNWDEYNLLPEWENGENDEDWFKKLGVCEFPTTFGEDIMPYMKIYLHPEKGYYLADFPLSDDISEFVLCPDFISLMMFTRDFASICFLSRIQFDISKIAETLEKAFTAWHGHPTRAICEDCSPMEWKRHNEHVEKRRQEKAQKAQETKAKPPQDTNKD